MKRNKLIVGIGLLLIGVFALYGFATAQMHFVAEWGSYGTSDGEFNKPRGIAVDSTTGNVLVADTDNQRIQKFTSSGVFITTLESPSPNFTGPHGIAVDSTGNVYVADTGSSRILRFDGSGWTVLPQPSPEVFDRPRGIAVDLTTDDVYVSDTYNNRIRKFNSGAWTTIELPSGYDRPSGIAVDSAGDVYVATRAPAINEYHIHKLDSSTLTWTTWNTSTNPLYDPRGIAVQDDLDGNIYICVADTYNDRILRFTTDGGYHDGWGSSGTVGGQFYLPFGIASDADGNVYVADTYNHRIQKFIPCNADPMLAVQGLIAKVLYCNLHNGIENSLDAKLQNALKSLDDANAGQMQAAINKLEAFINEVEAQSGVHIEEEDADALIAMANCIIQNLQQ